METLDLIREMEDCMADYEALRLEYTSEYAMSWAAQNVVEAIDAVIRSSSGTFELQMQRRCWARKAEYHLIPTITGRPYAS